MSNRFSVSAMFNAFDGMSPVIGRIEKRVNAMRGGLKNDFAGIGKGFGKLTDGIGQIATVAATAGAALGVLAATGLYEVMRASNAVADQTARIATVLPAMSNGVVQSADVMKAAALDWSKVHKTTAEDFLKSSYMMISAGLNQEQALAGSRTASLVATATFGDAGAAAEALAVQYNTLGNHTRNVNLEMAHLGDVMTKTQQTFQFKDLAQVTEGLKYATPTAKMFGQSVEALTTTMGMLNNAGIVGSSAGTAYTAMFEKMIPASKTLGFTIAHTKDGMLDLGGTLTNIHKKFGDFDKASDTTKASLEEAFGRRGITGIALLSDKANEFATNLGKISDNAGAAATAAATIESSGSGPIDILINKFTAAKVAMGDALSPSMGPMIDGIGRVADSVTTWVTANKDLINSGLGTVFATITPIVKTFGDSFMTALPAIKEAVGALFTGFGSGATWLATAKSAASILGMVAAGAIGVALVFGGVLAAGFQIAVDLSNDVIGAWNSMISGIGRVLFACDNFLEDLGAHWRAFKFADLANYLIDGLVKGIKEGAQWVVDAAKNLGQQALDGIKSALHIHSPSRAFAEVGNMSALGVAQGINEGAFAAVSASQALADGVLAAMTIKAPAVDTSALGGASAGLGAFGKAGQSYDPTALWSPLVNSPSLGSDHQLESSSAPEPQVVTHHYSSVPYQDGEPGNGGSRDSMEITIRPERGSSAEVTKAPTGGTKIVMAPSGGL